MVRFFIYTFLLVAALEAARTETILDVARSASAIILTPEVPEPDSPAEKPLNDGDLCDEQSLSTIVCQDDRLRFCGPNNKIMSVACEVNGRQGYCNCEKDSCVAQKPVCGDEKPETCLNPNTKLPDNLNCHKFTYCSEKKEKFTLECPGNLIYDPTLTKCMDIYTSPCNRVVCPKPGTRLQLIPFPQARNYYVLCYQGVGDVRKCPFEYYSVRNNVCQFDCKLRNASGLFKDTDVAKCEQGYYYSCRRSGTNFTTVKVKCPTGKFFDEDLGLCTSVNKCKTTEQK